MPAGSWRNYLAERSFYDLSVHSVPDGINTADELVSMAKHLGFAGVGLSNHSTAEGPLKSNGVEVFDIFRTIELVASNPSKLHGLVGKYRNKVDVLAHENISRRRSLRSVLLMSFYIHPLQRVVA